MGFKTPLDLRAYKPGEWVVLWLLIFAALSGCEYTVPRGFITDLASIPRLLRGIYNQNGLSRQAAVLHDYLYCAQLTTRKQADDLFLEALESLGISWAVRWSMWTAVRAGGWIYWNRRAGGLNQDDFVPVGYFDAQVAQ